MELPVEKLTIVSHGFRAAGCAADDRASEDGDLVFRASRKDRHRKLMTQMERGGGLFAQKVAVDGGFEVKRVVASGNVEELLRWESAKLRQRWRLAAYEEVISKMRVRRLNFAGVWEDGVHAGTTLKNGTVKEADGKRRSDEIADVECAGRLARDGDLMGVAAKLDDVPLHPVERGELIELTIISGAMFRGFSGELRCSVKPKDSQAVVDADDDDAMAREGFAKRRPLAGAFSIAAAMDPYENRQLRTRSEVRCPDVEEEACFVSGHTGFAEHLRQPSAGGLGARGAVRFCMKCVTPGGGGLRRTPAKISYRLRGIRDTKESAAFWQCRHQDACDPSGFDRDGRCCALRVRYKRSRSEEA